MSYVQGIGVKSDSSSVSELNATLGANPTANNGLIAVALDYYRTTTIITTECTDTILNSYTEICNAFISGNLSARVYRCVNSTLSANTVKMKWLSANAQYPGFAVIETGLAGMEVVGYQVSTGNSTTATVSYTPTSDGYAIAVFGSATGSCGDPSGWTVRLGSTWSTSGRLNKIADKTATNGVQLTATSTVTSGNWIAIIVVVRAGSGTTNKSASDTTSASVSESRSTKVSMSRPDATLLSASESRSLLVSMLRPDTVSSSLSDSVALQARLLLASATSVSVSDTSTLRAIVSRTDTTAVLLLPESNSVLSRLLRSDTVQAAAAEVYGSLVKFSNSDSTPLSLIDLLAASILVYKSASDTVSVSLVEGFVVRALILLALSDSSQVAVTETRSLAVFLSRMESLPLLLAEQRSLRAAITRTDATNTHLNEAALLRVNIQLYDTLTLLLTSISAIQPSTPSPSTPPLLNTAARTIYVIQPRRTVLVNPKGYRRYFTIMGGWVVGRNIIVPREYRDMENRPVEILERDADDDLPYSINWSLFLPAGQTIQSPADWTATNGLTVHNDTITGGNVTTAFVTGTPTDPDVVSEVRCTIQTSGTPPLKTSATIQFRAVRR